MSRFICTTDHEVLPPDGRTLLMQVERSICASSDRSTETVTIGFLKYEFDDLALRLQIENFERQITVRPLVVTDVPFTQLTSEDKLVLLVLNAAAKYRPELKEHLVQSSVSTMLDDDNMFCVTVRLPVLPRIPRGPLVRTSG